MTERLALDGGTPVRSQPFPPRRLFGAEEKRAVLDLFDEAAEKGDHILGYAGAQEEGYCGEFSALLGGGFADGVNSGTSAVFVAFRALELPAFSEVIVPAISDPGGVMPVVFGNCIPVPADCAPGSYNVGAEQIAARLTDRTSAILVAHIAGLPVDMDPVIELARKAGIPVIEDCAQAHGALYKGRPVGSIGNIAAFSTMSGKHHATGGQGGVVFTRDESLYWSVRRHADRGKPHGMESENLNVVAALNLNMDELHAAIGRVQLRKLPGIIGRRRELARTISRGCAELRAVRPIVDAPGCQGVYWFLFVDLDTDALTVDVAQFTAALAAEGLPTGDCYRYIPTDMAWARDRNVFGASAYPWSSPEYAGDPDQIYPLPNIEKTMTRTFRLALHESWTATDAEDAITALAKVERAYLR